MRARCSAMDNEINRIAAYCDTLLSISPPASLAEAEAEAFEFGRELIQEAFNDLNEYHKTYPTSALTLIADFMYATSLIARFLPQFEFVENEVESKLQREKAQLSANKRRLKAEKTWRAVALELAIASRNIDAGWSQDDVASYVHRNWPKATLDERPTHPTLKLAVSGWIKVGKLARPVR